MGKQLIIAVSREFGSGGHEIADILAKKFNIPIYDNNLLTEIANSKNLDVDTLEKYDEKPNHPALVSIFVLADKESKITRVSKHNDISRSEAESLINMQNKKRKTYHNRYCEDKWGDSRNYDVCVNSAKLGIERTADILEEYIKEFAQ